MLFAIGLAAVPTAGAATAAAVDQYQPQPPGGGGDPVGGQGPDGAGQSLSGTGQNPSGLPAGAEAQQGDGASLPFTGYPLTNLVLIIGLLVGAGIAVRFGVAGYQRLRPNAE